MTGGQGSYRLEFSHYESVPPTVQRQLESQYRVRDDA
jgi:elongation factor G